MELTGVHLLDVLRDYEGLSVRVGGSPNVPVRCFNPSHEDKTASMSVNVQKGTYRCHGCNVQGNAHTYLVDFQGMSKAEAMETLKKKYGASEEYVARRSKEYGLGEVQGPKRYDNIFSRWKAGKKLYERKAAEYRYFNKDNELVFINVRYEGEQTEENKPPKAYAAFTPISEDPGKYWLKSPMSDLIPAKDRVLNYPVYRLPQLLAADPGRMVHLVEGEKTADILGKLENERGVTPVSIALYGGSKMSLDKHDLSPLAGRPVRLFADADKGGVSFVKKVGKHLRDKLGCDVDYVIPPFEGEGDGYDVGDLIPSRGLQGFVEYVKMHLTTHSELFGTRETEKAEQEPKLNEVESLAPFIIDNHYFRVLGMRNERIVIQKKGKSPFTYNYSAGQLATMPVLISLASDQFWKQLFQKSEIKEPQRIYVLDVLMRHAESLGQVPDDMLCWGRGAVAIEGEDGTMRYYFNLGNSILEEDPRGELRIEKDFTEVKERIFSSGHQIKLKDSDKAQEWAAEFAYAVSAYRWETKEDAQFFLGWIVTSIIGGALQNRPVGWLTAHASSGKTFLMQNILQKIFAGMIQFATQPTEAAVAQAVGNDSLPVVLDEFEPQVGQENKIADIMLGMRSSTYGDGGMRIRGSASGGNSMNLRTRYSILFSSINMPSVGPAELTRIIQLKLGDPVDDWQSVKSDIQKATSPEKCKAIRTFIIRNTRKIVEAASALESKFLTEGYPSRQAQNLASLSAGYGFLTGRLGMMLYAPIIGQNEGVGPYRVLMNATIRVSVGGGGRETSVGDAIRAIMNHQQNDAFDYESVLARHGIRKHPSQRSLLLAKRHSGMRHLLKGSEFANIDLDNYLKSLPGCDVLRSHRREPRRIRFGGMPHYSVVIPHAMLEEWGPLEPAGGEYEESPQEEQSDIDDEIPF